MEYRKRLNPECSVRTPKGIKGTRQKVIVTHNPMEIHPLLLKMGITHNHPVITCNHPVTSHNHPLISDLCSNHP